MKQKFAIPLTNGQLSNHFGKADYFEIIDIQDGCIISNSRIESPLQEHGKLPEWITDKGVTHIIASGIGQKAITSLQARNIEIIYGVEPDKAEILVKKFLENKLKTSINLCDH